MLRKAENVIETHTDARVPAWGFHARYDFKTNSLVLRTHPKPDPELIVWVQGPRFVVGRITAPTNTAVTDAHLRRFAAIADGNTPLLHSELGAGLLDYAVAVGSDGVPPVLARSPSGCEPLFFAEIEGKLHVASHHALIRREMTAPDFSIEGVLGFLIAEFPLEPHTLVEGICAARRGALTLCKPGAPTETKPLIRPLFTVDISHENYEHLQSGLREHIVRAISDRLARHNAVYLSGGIDSNVMAAVLRNHLGLTDTVALTFRVKGLERDEAAVAALAARHLGLEHSIVELDPMRPVDLDLIIPTMNSPTAGAPLISLLATEGLRAAETAGQAAVFAGQDTRLHTPFLIGADEFFLMHLADARILAIIAAAVANLAMPLLNRRPGKWTKAIGLLADAWSPEGVMLRRYLKRFVKPAFVSPRGQALADKDRAQQVLSALRNSCGLDIRHRYNAIIDVYWDTQLVFDMQYMRDATGFAGHRCQLPFYDWNLAVFSAALPYRYVAERASGREGHHLSKYKSVNKMFLRRAFKNDLPDELLLRDKAVAPSAHLFLNGSFAPYTERLLKRGGIWDTSIGPYLCREAIQGVIERKKGNWTLSDIYLASQLLNIVWVDMIARTM
jgi:hypothetical protein